MTQPMTDHYVRNRRKGGITPFLLSLVLCLPVMQAMANTPNINAELLMQLDQLQSELQHLRNQVEQQQHALNQMQEQQRNRYLDLDQRTQDNTRRIHQLETGMTPPVATPVVPASVPQTPATLPEVVTNAADVADTTASELLVLSDREAYAQAYALVPERRFDEAITAFQNFIRQYPDSRLLGNSYYWIGEIHLAQNRTQEAERMFEAVVREYPDSFKVADSYYKLALLQARYGNEAAARERMQRIIQDYPNEPAAALARSWLQR